jgi:hypothetical protein
MKVKGFKILLLALVVRGATAAAGEIRLSFLEDIQIRNDTCELLRTNGVPEKVVLEFRRIVNDQNAAGNGVDTKLFPPIKSGWYQFQNLTDLTSRQACEFARIPGKPSLVCYDVLGMLLYGTGVTAGKFYDNFETKEILVVSPDRNQIGPANIGIFRTGTGLLSPPSYYEYFVGRPRSDAETELVLLLRAPRRIRSGETETDERLRARFADHVKNLRKDGFEFPKKMQVGMVFYVDARRGIMMSDHAFLCFKTGNKLTTVEKTSSRGPFVRGEFEDKADLAAYACMAERSDSNNPQDCDYGDTVAVSLNDELIGIFRSKKSQQ